jgi:hypothetical protein
MVKIKQEQTKKEEVVVAIQCDCCKKVYHAEETRFDEKMGVACITNQNDMWDLQEFHHIDFTGGYGSIFGDGTQVQCDICQHCLHKMISPFMRAVDPYQ